VILRKGGKLVLKISVFIISIFSSICCQFLISYQCEVAFEEGEIEIVFFPILGSFESLGVFLFFLFLVENLKVLSVLFLGIILLTIMTFTFDVQSIEKLNGNNFHTWKMKMEFFLHEKDL
jgi:hypothetical protein